MSRLLPFVIGLLFASLLGLTSAFYLSDESSNMSRFGTPGLALSMASVSEPPSDEVPGDVAGRFPHAHSECHGDHMKVPAMAIISQMEPEEVYSTSGQRISEGVIVAPTLRPPKL
ncbi:MULTISPECIES: hypothetical protein [Sphingomonadaceae]|jgi:hypothetical protein|uniref:hypothetical protein n=1 Tax=Sphingomonadaceae TaxID=41297 RepID=UPI0007857AA8|nr:MULTISPECIES: hypothetical protein [Sphingomonadaceae]